jgi:hypothetical protein
MQLQAVKLLLSGIALMECEALAEPSAMSPDFREWWQGTEVKGFDEVRKRLLLPMSAYIDFTYVALTPEERPDLLL